MPKPGLAADLKCLARNLGGAVAVSVAITAVLVALSVFVNAGTSEPGDHQRHEVTALLVNGFRY